MAFWPLGLVQALLVRNGDDNLRKGAWGLFTKAATGAVVGAAFVVVVADGRRAPK